MSIGVAPAIFPTSSSACMIRLMRAESGWGLRPIVRARAALSEQSETTTRGCEHARHPAPQRHTKSCAASYDTIR